MRLELHLSVLAVCIFFIIIVWLFAKKYRSKPYFIFILSLCGALLLPAFIPAHGEIIIALPNAALFTVSNSIALGAGLFYLVINFFISFAILNIAQKYKASK